MQRELTDQRAYATADNLRAAIARLGLMDYHHIIVYNSEGRATAIFALTQKHTLDPIYPTRHGFMVFG